MHQNKNRIFETLYGKVIIIFRKKEMETIWRKNRK